jgi:hypothetical protein
MVAKELRECLERASRDQNGADKQNGMQTVSDHENNGSQAEKKDFNDRVHSDVKLINGGRVMLTLFAIPKAFAGHIGIIQRNAIESWTLLRPQCEIILFGDDEGTAEVAREFGLRHVPQIARNEWGTPLLNDMFETAQRLASHKMLCFVNADIILTSDFLRAVERVSAWRDKFLMVGRRRDVGITEPWEFARPNWEKELRDHVLKHGELRGEHAVDYFVFPEGLYDHIPPFAIGRPCYDSWLIYKPISRRYPVIDATNEVVAIHQNHDHSHFGLQGENYSLQEALKLEECNRNYNLLGGEFRRFGVTDASHILMATGECRRKYVWWRFEVLKKQVKRKITHELLEKTRPIRHRLGLRESSLRALKSTWTLHK